MRRPPDPPPVENIRQRSWRIKANVDKAKAAFDEGDVTRALDMLAASDRDAEGIWNDPHDDLTLFDHDDVLVVRALTLARAGAADAAFATLERIGNRYKRIDTMHRLVREDGGPLIDPGRLLPLAEAMRAAVYADKLDEARDGDLQWLCYLMWHLGRRDEAATTAAWIGEEGVRAVTFGELARMIAEGEAPPVAAPSVQPAPPTVGKEVLGPVTVFIFDNYHGTNPAEAETLQGFWSEAEAERYARARVRASIERFRQRGQSQGRSFRRMDGERRGRATCRPLHRAGELRHVRRQASLRRGDQLPRTDPAAPSPLTSAKAFSALARCSGLISPPTARIAVSRTPASSVKPRPATKSGIMSAGTTK